MLGGLSRIVTHPAAGVAWSLASVALAATLAMTSIHAHRKEDFLRERIAALATHDAAQVQAELVSCRVSLRSYEAATMAVATSSRRGARRGGTATPGVRHDRASVAAELAASSPAGFDTCARMESADRAVLKALDRR